MKKLVIFDLDGTLLNTIYDLGAAVNFALETCGYPTHQLQQYPFMVGNGITRLIERALPEGNKDEETIMRVRAVFVEYYDEHKCVRTVPYTGINELLTELAKRNIMIAVASNKYERATVQLISHYFGNYKWVAVHGQRDGIAVKPNPQIVYDILAEAGVSADDTLYVGDSGVDMSTACNAAVESVGVTWGFRPESELQENEAVHIVHNAAEILNFI